MLCSHQVSPLSDYQKCCVILSPSMTWSLTFILSLRDLEAFYLNFYMIFTDFLTVKRGKRVRLDDPTDSFNFFVSL